MFHLIAASSISLLRDFRHEVVVTLMVTGFLGAVSYPFRQAKAKWEAMTAKLNDVHAELTLQRSNCLTTLQTQGDKQIECLEKVADTLGDIRLDNREMLTHLRDKF
jgi:hypothetical protein